MHKNSFDLLRLAAATMVLYSHQYALLGLPEPSFMGWNSWGGAGVTIFFFLSGFLVSTSWERDPNLQRFFRRRLLRILPGLWVVVLLSVLVVGPVFTVLSPGDYFSSSTTVRYLGTGVLVSTKVLPGVFSDNPVPFVVNGSLWTLPVEFLCYCSVAVVGLILVAFKGKKDLLLGLGMLGVVLVATYGPLLIGGHFTPHFEMGADFWWGVFYGYCLREPRNRVVWILAAFAFLGFAVLGPRAAERTAMLVSAAILVQAASRTSVGARWTDPVGDLSYGVYIFAFPVQQMGVQWGRSHDWSFTSYLSVSMLVTLGLAYASWHVVEKRALRLKPKRVSNP